MKRIPRAVAAVVVAVSMATVAGCGFIAAGQKSVQKPNTFILLGRAEVALPASDHSAPGTTCSAPSSVSGVAPNTPVKVLDNNSVKIAEGALGTGILARSGATTTCAFPFQIDRVPGGSPTYGVMIGDRPAQSFPASKLRQNTPAVVTITH